MSNTALLLMDLQNGIVSMVGGANDYMARMQRLATAARAADIPVIYVVVKFRKGFPDVSPNNKSFSQLKNAGMPFTEEDDATNISQTVAPQPGDIVVTKRRVGAFSGSDLEIVLRSQGIQHIVLAGLATSGVVLSTVRLAADMDYKITVLSDGCADQDAEVHRVLMEKVFPRQADVLSCEEWMKRLR